MQYFVRKKLLLLSIFAIHAITASAQREYLVTVNPATGAVTKIDSIPGVKWLIGNYKPSYCESSRVYSFLGGENPSGNDFRLFTIDAVTGHTISNPLFPDLTKFTSIQYARTTNRLFGAGIFSQSTLFVEINAATGAYTTLRALPNFSIVLKIMVDDLQHVIYLYGADQSGNRILCTVDINSATVISQVFLQPVVNVVYNKVTNSFYGITVEYPVFPQTRPTFIFCKINAVSGALTNIGIINNLAVINSGNETLDENNGRYFFTGTEFNDALNYLYTTDITTGHTTKVPVPAGSTAAEDNLVEFRYDNNLNRMYALFWEGHTVVTPPPATAATLTDSACNLSLKVKVYPNPADKKLIIDKKRTVCNVFANIYNTAGQLMVKGRKVGDGYNEIDLSGLAAGVYFYEFIADEKVLLSGTFLKK
jgi:hypothetical protein